MICEIIDEHTRKKNTDGRTYPILESVENKTEFFLDSERSAWNVYLTVFTTFFLFLFSRYHFFWSQYVKSAPRHGNDYISSVFWTDDYFSSFFGPTIENFSKMYGEKVVMFTRFV